MFVVVLFGILALLSLVLTLWQWMVAMRFPLHRGIDAPMFAPPVTLLKPLKGWDSETELCLRSWFAQRYGGPVQILFGVADASDPVCALVNKLLAQFPDRDARLVLCNERLGANAKVSTLVQLQQLARHDITIVSDADVRVPPDLLTQIVLPLRNEGAGLVNCFYKLGNPSTLAMRWEAVAVNADFWSQVLQARSLKPIDFALGAVMALRRQELEQMGGFESLLDYLADDYQLGHRVAGTGREIVLSPTVVECRSAPLGWREVWSHQLRWARTIRFCQPAAYFLSILSNATLWPLVWLLGAGSVLEARGINHCWRPALKFESAASTFYATFTLDWVLAGFVLCLIVRVLTALALQSRLTRSVAHFPFLWLAPVKDLAQVFIWALAFAGREVVWRGQRYRVEAGGKLTPQPQALSRA